MVEQSNTPTILVVLGATGDLMARKIIPSLHHLFRAEKLPLRFKVIGFARRDLTDDVFHRHVADQLHSDTSSLHEFLGLFSYHRGEFHDPSGYQRLIDRLRALDGELGGFSNKLFYLATPPDLYEEIFKQLASSGLAGRTAEGDAKTGWTRVIVEKPFGRDSATAERLDVMLGSLFHEAQIYRVDHYLAKEMVQNILSFRFSNNLFEALWSGEFIESIEVRLWETLGVEKRGAFYDALGALRDVGQNHLLQMLALVIMEHPTEFSPAAIRTKRAEALRTLPQLTIDEVAEGTRRAQYSTYRTIEGVDPNSNTETYFRIGAFLNSARWQNVPIILEGGKRLRETRKEIVVQFRHREPCLCPGSEHYKNRVVISLEPEEAIKIEFWAKRPGHRYELQSRSFDFLLRGEHARVQYIEEYEKLLLDAISGDQTLFVSTAEVKAMWRFIDPVTSAWSRDVVPLEIYEPDRFPINSLYT
ncbi:MAG: glucose-6-phosphate dehydrogenase [Candidatus Sungbacteria bacterium]|nr:glucose-6-phosphate dehydrogenase [Candidatus Sungbacteria bacterium]